MVQEANIKRAQTEKALAESEMKVILQFESIKMGHLYVVDVKMVG